MRVALVLYGDLDFISGGFLYDRMLVDYLRRQGEEVEVSSKSIARYWSKCLIELRRAEKDNHRIAILRKHRSLPEGRKIEFEIAQKGLKESKFSIF